MKLSHAIAGMIISLALAALIVAVHLGLLRWSSATHSRLLCSRLGCSLAGAVRTLNLSRPFALPEYQFQFVGLRAGFRSPATSGDESIRPPNILDTLWSLRTVGSNRAAV